MRTLTWLVALLASVLPAHAALAGGAAEERASTSPPPTIVAEVTLPASEVDATPESVPASVPCRWDRIGATMDYAEQLNGVYELLELVIRRSGGDFVIAVTFYAENGTLHRYNDVNGRYEYSVEADCTDATAPGGWETGDVDWREAGPPDPAILLPGNRRRVTEPIRPPIPDISPVEGVVNLGMWLAVEPVGQVSVTAELGPTVWARTTAQVTGTSFTLSSDDDTTTVTCEGSGTPIPKSAMESVEEGPCGYTYTRPVDGGTIAVTSTWSVTWELSDGRTGSFQPLQVTTVIPYDVIEIQTVGTRN